MPMILKTDVSGTSASSFDAASVFFVHRFGNVILTGAMIYPFGKIYSIVVIPVLIGTDLVFYAVMTGTGLYKSSMERMAGKEGISDLSR